MLERDVEGASLTAPRLGEHGDAVVERGRAAQDGDGVVVRSAVDDDQVPVGHRLRLQ